MGLGPRKASSNHRLEGLGAGQEQRPPVGDTDRLSHCVGMDETELSPETFWRGLCSARMRFTLVSDRGSRGDVVLDRTGSAQDRREIGVYDVENPQIVASVIREAFLLPQYSKPKKTAAKSE